MREYNVSPKNRASAFDEDPPPRFQPDASVTITTEKLRSCVKCSSSRTCRAVLLSCDFVFSKFLIMSVSHVQEVPNKSRRTCYGTDAALIPSLFVCDHVLCRWLSAVIFSGRIAPRSSGAILAKPEFRLAVSRRRECGSI